MFRFLWLLLVSALRGSSAERPPHILLVLADDYGWAHFGPHVEHEQGEAREIFTPSMDELVREGVLLDRHYSYKMCSPSRSSLQSGRLAVHVNVVNTGVTSMNKDDPVRGFPGIPRNMTTVAERLKGAGYQTHAVGKWDVGMATMEHTPKGRGYDDFLGYWQHANDYWTCATTLPSVGEVDNCLNAFADFSKQNESYTGPAVEERAGCGTAPEDDEACYEEDILRDRTLEIIRSHDDEKGPLFLFHSFHLIHTPLQLPQSALDAYGRLTNHSIDSMNREKVGAMTLYMDTILGRIVGAMKQRSMWEDTLLIFLADNGGALYEPGSGNNHPLRGGKFSDFEGGIRTNAFVSGGYVPEQVRGGSFGGLVSIADWYATICHVAGARGCDRDAKAEEAGLPQPDSVNQWPYIAGQQEGWSRRQSTPFHVSEQAIIEYPWKWVVGRQPYGTWTGKHYPNCSTIASLRSARGPFFSDFQVFGYPAWHAGREKRALLLWEHDCGAGCLFNIEDDPTEHRPIPGDPQGRARRMEALLEDANKYLYKPDRGTPSPEACIQAVKYGGYYGPFVDVKFDSDVSWLRLLWASLKYRFLSNPAVTYIIQRSSVPLTVPMEWYAEWRMDKCFGPGTRA